MIKKKLHTKIAKFLLGCMLVVGLPFHDFLHEHIQIEEHFVTPLQKHREFQKAEKIAKTHDCIACSISQLAHTLFVKTADILFIFDIPHFLYFQKESSQVNLQTFYTEGRAPPEFFF